MDPKHFTREQWLAAATKNDHFFWRFCRLYARATETFLCNYRITCWELYRKCCARAAYWVHVKIAIKVTAIYLNVYSTKEYLDAFRGFHLKLNDQPVCESDIKLEGSPRKKSEILAAINDYRKAISYMTMVYKSTPRLATLVIELIYAHRSHELWIEKSDSLLEWAKSNAARNPLDKEY